MQRLLIWTLATLIWPLAVHSSDGTPHWDYEGAEGPEHWGALADEFDMCSRGRNQSPIDLVADIDTALPEVNFEYAQAGQLVEVNTGHAIQENVKPGNHVSFRGHRFELQQFHFHSPSEHTMGGEHYPMEVHLVHKNEAGELLVVGVLFKEGERNKLMDQLPSFRAARGEDPGADAVDYNDLFPARDRYFLYNGSLTTPPCSEGVRWVVMQQPVTASPDQIQHYHDLLGFDNNRPIQPRNARIVLD